MKAIHITLLLRQTLLSQSVNDVRGRCPKCGAIAVVETRTYEPMPVTWELCSECDYTAVEADSLLV